MDVFGWDREGAEDYDLLVLNFYVLLDALRRRNDDLHRSILARWEEFQRLQRAFPEDETFRHSQ